MAKDFSGFYGFSLWSCVFRGIFCLCWLIDWVIQFMHFLVSKQWHTFCPFASVEAWTRSRGEVAKKALADANEENERLRNQMTVAAEAGGDHSKHDPAPQPTPL